MKKVKYGIYQATRQYLRTCAIPIHPSVARNIVQIAFMFIHYLMFYFFIILALKINWYICHFKFNIQLRLLGIHLKISKSSE